MTHRLEDGLAVAPREHFERREALLGHVHALDHLQLLQEARHSVHHHHGRARQRLHHVRQSTTSVVHLQNYAKHTNYKKY